MTDLLLQCHATKHHRTKFDQTFNQIEERYQSIVEGLGLSIDMGRHLDDAKRAIWHPESSVDLAGSRGESLMGIVLAEALGRECVDPTILIALGSRGEYLEGASAVKFRGCLHESAVIPGFYGADNDGNLRTFSRGGSDITGAIVAAQTAAALYENWTDVNGIFEADPAAAPDANPINTLSYAQLRQLAKLGANVMHPDAVTPCEETVPEMLIRNTNHPELVGTSVSRAPASQDTELIGFAARGNRSVLSASPGVMRRHLNEHPKLQQAEWLFDGPESEGWVFDATEHELQPVIEATGARHTAISLIGALQSSTEGSMSVTASLFDALSRSSIDVRYASIMGGAVVMGVPVEQTDSALQSLVAHKHQSDLST